MGRAHWFRAPLVAALLGAAALAGCASSPETPPAPPATSAPAASSDAPDAPDTSESAASNAPLSLATASQLINQRFGECIRKLGDDPGSAAAAGTVPGSDQTLLVRVSGQHPIVFKAFPTDDGPTVGVDDEATNRALDSVGC